MITIDEAIARVPQWRGMRAGSVVPLAGGITNLNYRVEIGGDTFVLSIAGVGTDALGVDRSRAYEIARAAGDLGVGPEVVCLLPDDGILVARFIWGRRLVAGDAVNPGTLARIVRSFHRYHGGPAFPGAFSPFETLRAYLRTAQQPEAPRMSGAAPAAGAAPASERAQTLARLPDDTATLYERMAVIERLAQHGCAIARPCHNDLWQSNLIDDGHAIRIIDWEYAGMGDVYFDLANFAIHNTFGDAEDQALLRTYFGTIPAAGVARLKLLKAAAELREAMWAVVGQHLPATTASGFDAPAYAVAHFERCRRALADPRFSGWVDEITR
jgi:thiamine kinase-like enzyme